jgi:hypothetical protein
VALAGYAFIPRTRWPLALILASILMTVVLAHAEGFIDFYLGAAITRDSDQLGLALDASFFRPDKDLTVIPVSALAMLRLSMCVGASRS